MEFTSTNLFQLLLLVSQQRCCFNRLIESKRFHRSNLGTSLCNWSCSGESISNQFQRKSCKHFFKGEEKTSMFQYVCCFSVNCFGSKDWNMFYVCLINQFPSSNSSNFNSISKQINPSNNFVFQNKKLFGSQSNFLIF